MTPEEIKGLIRKKGLTQHGIAKKLQRSDMAISTIINRIRVSDYIMRGIAEAICEKHTVVFPDYYLSPPKRSTSKIDKVIE